MIKRKLKQYQIKRLHDHVPICNRIDGKAIVPPGQWFLQAVVIHKDRIRPHKKEAHSFADIFGTINSGGIILSGVSFDQAEDLTLAGDNLESYSEFD